MMDIMLRETEYCIVNISDDSQGRQTNLICYISY